MNNDLREIAIRTDSGDAWENPFSHEDVAQAISTIRYINSKDLTENTYDLLTALADTGGAGGRELFAADDQDAQIGGGNIS